MLGLYGVKLQSFRVSEIRESETLDLQVIKTLHPNPAFGA